MTTFTDPDGRVWTQNELRELAIELGPEPATDDETERFHAAIYAEVAVHDGHGKA